MDANLPLYDDAWCKRLQTRIKEENQARRKDRLFLARKFYEAIVRETGNAYPSVELDLFMKSLERITTDIAPLVVPAEDVELVCGHKKTKQAKTRQRLDNLQRVREIFEDQGFAFDTDHGKSMYMFTRGLPAKLTEKISDNILELISGPRQWDDYTEEENQKYRRDQKHSTEYVHQICESLL